MATEVRAGQSQIAIPGPSDFHRRMVDNPEYIPPAAAIAVAPLASTQSDPMLATQIAGSMASFGQEFGAVALHVLHAVRTIAAR